MSAALGATAASLTTRPLFVLSEIAVGPFNNLFRRPRSEVRLEEASLYAHVHQVHETLAAASPACQELQLSFFNEHKQNLTVLVLYRLIGVIGSSGGSGLFKTLLFSSGVKTVEVAHVCSCPFFPWLGSALREKSTVGLIGVACYEANEWLAS